MNNEDVTIIRSNAELASFKARHPDGFTIMDGDRGIGVTGQLAQEVKNIGGNPENWIRFAAKIGPFIHQAHE